MGAWGIVRSWNSNDEKELAFRAQRLTPKTSLAGLRRYTCEDLLLAELIDYARFQGLPVRLHNGQGVWDSREYSGDWVSFRDAVLKTTGAADIARPENSITIGVGRKHRSGEDSGVRTKRELLPLLARARPGMLLLLGEPGEIYHCQLVGRRMGNQVQIWQGNFRSVERRSAGQTISTHPCERQQELLTRIVGGGPSHPTSSCYVGSDLQRGTYDLGEMTYRRDGGDLSLIGGTLYFGCVLCRWNFAAFE